MVDLVQDILDNGTSTITESKDSVTWFKNKLEEMKGKKIVFNKKSFPEIGKMYLFVYDAKHKATLPFFDVYPLVFPVEYYSDGFLGINLHYLPPNARLGLLDSLSSIASDNKYTDNTKLNISYSVLKQASDRFGNYSDCVKRYLFGQVRSGFNYVSPTDWPKAAVLPLHKWSINTDMRYRKSSPPY
jgi:hypothetical protein